jgi:chitinase
MVNGNLFTHMNFAFGALNSAFDAIPGETTDVTEQYPAFLGLRTKYPHLKLLMSFGGYSFNAPGSSTERIFSTMVQNSANRAKFISSAIAFCRKYKFDGVDIDWEYPTYADQGGVPADKPNFTLFLKEFRDAINAEVRAAGVDKLLLTIASPAEASILTGYELDKIHLSLDWINIMAYDMAGEWDGVTGFHTKMQGITDGVDYYLSFGIPPEKLVLGLATYGRSFTLKSSTNHGVGAAISGVGNALTCTGEAGFVAYYEIKQMIASGAVEVYDDAQKSAYCYLGNQWVGYDNPKSMLYKAQYINSKGLGGGMFWALDLDAPTGGYSELQCVVAQTLFASRTTTQPPPARSPPTSAAVRAPSTVQPPPTRSPPTPAVVLAPRTTNPPPAQTPNLPTPSVQWTKKGSGKFGRKG